MAQHLVGNPQLDGIGNTGVSAPNVSEEDWAELRCSFVFPPGVAWVYDGKGTKLGAWGSLLASLPGFLEEVGACQVATVVDVNNWKSLDTQRSLGFENIGWVACLALGPFVRSAYKPRGGPRQRLPRDTGRLMLRNTHRAIVNAVETTDVTATSLE